MKLEPLTKYKPKPVGICLPSRGYLQVQTETGFLSAHGADAIAALLADLSGYVLYVHDSLESMIHTTGALSWTLSMWRNRVTRAIHTPTRTSVVSLRNTLDPATAMDDLGVVLRWLRAYGVSAGSIPNMAWGLFRASLARSYSCGFDPEIGRAAFYGGRQEANTAGIYRNMAAIDIQAAYPAAMARPEGYALTLREVDVSTELDPTAAGIATADVLIPEHLVTAPLPIRIDTDVVAYQRGHITGTWAWCELAAAERLGAEINVTRCWGPARTAELFGPWWPLAMEGRSLPGRAGILAKAISNSTWGQFGMVAHDRSRRVYTDDTGTRWVDVALPDHDLPHSWTAHVAAETTARVRTQLLQGMAETNPVHADTDGIIVPAGTVPAGMGDQPGQWRIKSAMPTVEVRGPQLYRWTCPECGHTHDHWHYNTSGVPANEASDLFERKQVGIRVTRSYR